MNNRPFPPVVLTHITKDNALFYGACIIGINKVMGTHQLSHLTAISVSTLLKSKKLILNEVNWIKRIAGLNGHKYGTRYGDRYGEGNGYGEWDEDGDGYGDGNGYIDEYGYGYSNGDGEGYGYGDENQAL